MDSKIKLDMLIDFIESEIQRLNLYKDYAEYSEALKNILLRL